MHYILLLEGYNCFLFHLLSSVTACILTSRRKYECCKKDVGKQKVPEWDITVPRGSKCEKRYVNKIKHIIIITDRVLSISPIRWRHFKHFDLFWQSIVAVCCVQESNDGRRWKVMGSPNSGSSSGDHECPQHFMLIWLWVLDVFVSKFDRWQQNSSLNIQSVKGLILSVFIQATKLSCVACPTYIKHYQRQRVA